MALVENVARRDSKDMADRGVSVDGVSASIAFRARILIRVRANQQGLQPHPFPSIRFRVSDGLSWEYSMVVTGEVVRFSRTGMAVLDLDRRVCPVSRPSL